jgi:aminopeptidase N
MRHVLASLLVATACGDDSTSTPDAGAMPVANLAREIIDTQLAFDVSTMSGTATITFGPSATPGATLEVGDLMLDSVSVANARTEKLLDLALPASDSQLAVDIVFHYATHTGFDGAAAGGYTLIWPYYCGNLFPCHSAPDDGTTFSLAVNGVVAPKTAVYPAMLAEAPSYQIAWSIDTYTELPLGTTTAGTQIVVWHRANRATQATGGTQNLVAAFNWLEQTIGAYRFGPKAGGVDVAWGPGAFGGMEHHPYWHVGSAALSDQETQVHEAAHGWYGDGIRIKCWEDFVLSEGTVTYLAARALDVVAPTVGAAVWQSYTTELGDITGTDPVWPDSCGAIDIIEDNLFTRAPYIRGAFFYKAVADRVTPALLDTVLAQFYAAHAGEAATMAEMLDTIETVTGFDPTACAQMWLRNTTVPTPGACP